MRSFIIHLPGDHKRADNVARLLERLPDAQVVDAVLGREVVATDGFPLRSGDLWRPKYPFALSAGEVGCFLSHRRAWQMIIDQGLDYALIVEDDLAVDPALWADALELVERAATPDCFIRLPAKRREAGPASDSIGSAELFTPRRIGLQTVAQVVGQNAAHRLLMASETIDRPVDTYLQMHWEHGQKIQTILPNGVSELTQELGGSTIQKKKTGSKLRREINRAWYRTQVALRPQDG